MTFLQNRNMPISGNKKQPAIKVPGLSTLWKTGMISKRVIDTTHF